MMSFDPTNHPRIARLLLASVLPLLCSLSACDESIDPEPWEQDGESEGDEAATDAEEAEDATFRQAYPYMEVWGACSGAYGNGQQVEQCIVNVCGHYGCV